jgi:hypothetical protein
MEEQGAQLLARKAFRLSLGGFARPFDFSAFRRYPPFWRWLMTDEPKPQRKFLPEAGKAIKNLRRLLNRTRTSLLIWKRGAGQFRRSRSHAPRHDPLDDRLVPRHLVIRAGKPEHSVFVKPHRGRHVPPQPGKFWSQTPDSQEDALRGSRSSPLLYRWMVPCCYWRTWMLPPLIGC